VKAGYRHTVVIAVCHPDDEVIWVGGLIAALSRYHFLRVLVICLSGNDPASPRVAEFAAARSVAGYERGVILGGPLRGANDPLPPLGPVLEEGLARLGVAHSDIALLITHPAHGDEHTHPHHRQAFADLSAWSAKEGVPFGFFSYMPLPHLCHRPMLQSMRRDRRFHVVNLAECELAWPGIFWRSLNRRHPRYYLLFSVDPELKRRMLDCYRSINLDAHIDGYAMTTANVEGLYLCDSYAIKIFHELLDAMPPPAVHNALAEPPTIPPSSSGILARARRIRDWLRAS
jgi:LmbE family N-acetylglucosaminyl deacetylase